MHPSRTSIQPESKSTYTTNVSTDFDCKVDGDFQCVDNHLSGSKFVYFQVVYGCYYTRLLFLFLFFPFFLFFVFTVPRGSHLDR